MKKPHFLLLISLAEIALFSASTAQSVVPEKAAKVARSFVSLIYNEQPDGINISPVEAGDVFTKVQAVTPSRICDLTMRRDANANDLGWVVAKHDCKSRKL